MDRVASDEDGGAHAVSMERRSDRRRACAPVVAGNGKPIEAKRVSKVNDVLPDCSLLGHARSGRVAEARGTVTTQVRHQHPISRLD